MGLFSQITVYDKSKSGYIKSAKENLHLWLTSGNEDYDYLLAMALNDIKHVIEERKNNE